MKYSCPLPLILLFCTAIHLHAQILITEIQPVPNGEPEWIELINISDKTVNLDDWFICDSRSCNTFPKFSILPRSTFLLTRDAEGLREIRNVPDDVLVLEFSMPSLNNTTDRVELRNDDSLVVDSMSYDIKKFVKGRSIERMGVCNIDEASAQGDDPNNAADECIEWSSTFGISTATDSATCGTFNSAVQLPYDLRVAEIRSNDASVSVDIINQGLNTMHGVNIDLYSYQTSYDSSSGSLLRFKVASVTAQTTRLDPGQVYTWEIPLSEIGGYTSVASVELEAYIRVNDSRNANDKLRVFVVFPPPPGSITFTEIMFDPWPDMKDYVEVYNGTDDTIDLTGWILEDELGDRGIVSTFTIMDPHSYIVLSTTDGVRRMMQDGSPSIIRPEVSWNTTSDICILRTPHGFLVDRFQYNVDWHQPILESTKGISLEKYDPKLLSENSGSWTSSSDLRGGTPGRANSIDLSLLNRESELIANPSPFSSERTHPTNPTVLEFKQPFQQAFASMYVYTPSGMQVRTLLNTVFSGSEGAVAWDGTDDSGARVTPGQYIVVFSSVDAVSSNINKSTCVVVVGE